MQGIYKEVRNQMKVGDLIAFSGKSNVSNIIKWKTKTDISHVGMVYDTDITGEKRVELIESTSISALKDPYKKKFVKGVQRNYLSDVIDSYDGQVYWLPLKRKISKGKEAAMLSWLFTTWQEEVDYDAKGAIKAGLKIIELLGIERQPDFSTLFCSEMVARAYQIAGLLDENINASRQTPADTENYVFLNPRVQIK